MNKNYSLPGLLIETTFVYDFISQGEVKSIDYINPDNGDILMDKDNAVILFTGGNPVIVSNEMKTGCVAVVVDSNMAVTKVINKVPDKGIKPSFTESVDVEIPDGGFMVLSYDSDYENSGIRSFFAEKFNNGDIIKLRMNNTKISLEEVLQLTGQAEMKASISLLNGDYCTTEERDLKLAGFIRNPLTSAEYKIEVKKYGASGEFVEEKIVEITDKDDFGFLISLQLNDGVNYVDLSLYEAGQLLNYANQKRIVFKKKQKTLNKDKQVIMWVEQFVNAKTLNTVEKMEQVIATAKDAGITEFAVDVKGCEGFAAYKKATLTHAPYITETRDPRKKAEMEIDFLEEFVRIAHKHNMKVYASFNFFVEGNISTEDYAIHVPDKHPGWAEVIQAPEDKGELKSVLHTKRNAMLLYVNPANDEVQDFQLKRVEEVLMNYSIDGVILDRARYDHQYADFSEETKEKFIAYLTGKNKALDNWPADVYSIGPDGTVVLGKHYFEWITFRSLVISNFSNRLRALVNQYGKNQNRDIKLAAYVGSWYETYYQNGVNWADESFIYNERLDFPLPPLYTREYAKASYLDNIDFIMIGCYYDTKEQIEKYVTLGNILTNEKVDLIGSISLPDLKTPEELRNGFQTVYQNSNGGMIFDLCYTDWTKLKPAIQNEEI
ncbi:family 10 glycosylhydrolase [Anaerocolumna sp.]|uniref:family 10 glycosylhydrolase n=1 Tax=Anaerocolumna sp. TaxID=2041569 RepID=UPI0028B1BF2C|nr:family 10 glycosylhydrolase [Anaerocolumna sp.]